MKDIKKQKQKTFNIVGITKTLFDNLNKISIRNLVVGVLRQSDLEIFHEQWVFFSFIGSILLLIISRFIYEWKIISYLIILLGILKVFEIVVYQIKAILFDPFDPSNIDYKVVNHQRALIMILYSYFEIVIWFAIFYCNLQELFKINGVQLDSIIGSVYFSFITMATVGYGDIIPKNTWGAMICLSQVCISITITIIIISRVISMLPRVNEIKK